MSNNIADNRTEMHNCEMHNAVETAYLEDRPRKPGTTASERAASLLAWWSASVTTLRNRGATVDQALIDIAARAGVKPLGMPFPNDETVE